ncbi:MAG TPA: M23 family metallopeptidase [Solirubrobacteraceae bacterium]|nr:M23 family metallopeptidase [Solirubrobacteraceae bacterium]
MWRAYASSAAIAVACTALGATPACALSNVPGGAIAPSSPRAGASEAGVLSAAAPGPTVARLSVPTTVLAGPPPRVLLRVDEPGATTVEVRVAITSVATRRLVLVVALGWVRTGRTTAVRWPADATLSPGVYHVSLSARDPHGASLLRRPHRSGVASLTVSAPSARPVPSVPSRAATPAIASEAGAPTPAQTVLDGAAFPVAGAHSFGGPENRFGAPREGHIHQGQDVLTAEGTPIVAPLAGTITYVAYQAAGAGYYLVEHTGVDLDFMFAHCEADTFAVSEGQAIGAGQTLCSAGQTGDATAPHLHFEIWIRGWQAAGGRPIDPLPYLEAWEH